MLKIIGRDSEKKILDNVLNSKKAEFLAVYGRRRVGKTYLIREFFKDKKSYFFQTTGIKGGLLTKQLYEFTRVLEKHFLQEGMRLKEPKSWLEAFEMLTKSFEAFAKKRKIVLFFDETPWLSSKKSGFLEAIDYYWNTQWSLNPNVKLIICGSAASWIIDHVINSKGGLHNRTTTKMRLDPFSLNETKRFLESQKIKWSLQQIIELYMVTGGIPYYLSLIQKNLSLIQNIDHLCFNKNGILFTEYENLIPALFDHPEVYLSIIKYLSSRLYGVPKKDLIKHVKIQSGGTLSKYLSALEESGFITQFLPYGHKKRGLFYKIIDEYTMFYLKWIEPNVSTITHMKSSQDYWSSLSLSSSYKSWSGYSFESVCYKHLTTIKKSLKIPSACALGFWQYKDYQGKEGAQIDLLFDRNDNVINICEIKFNKEPLRVDKEFANQLNKKLEIFQRETNTNKTIFVSLVTLSGIKNQFEGDDVITSFTTAKDLFMGE